MKKYFTTIIRLLLPCLVTLPLIAQQVPVFNSHLYLPELYNPARMGDGFIGLNYRQQWMDLDSKYAPVSYSLTADLSSVFSLDGKRVGLGISLLGDKAHLVQRYNAALSFAYRLVDLEEHRLALGVLAGVTSQRYDFADARIFDPFDRAVFSEQQSVMVFDGGPGLYYQFQASDEHRISVDISAPQLFSSDLDFEDGGLLDVQPHLQARVSYRYGGSAFSVEPMAAYRDLIGEKKLKAGNIDLALRFGFLDNRVWVGGGMRLDAEALHISVGVKPVAKLEVLGAFELNSIFGNTFEVGALYAFSASTKISFAQELQASQSALTGTLVQESEIKDALKVTEAKIAGVTQPGAGTEQKRANLAEAREEIKQSRARLDLIRGYQLQAADAKSEATNKAGDNRSATKMKDFKTISDNAATIEDIAAKTNTAVNSAEQRLYNAEAQLPPQITEAVRSSNLPAIKAFFQERLDNLTEKPRNTQPIIVVAADRAILVRYEFFNQVEQYDISGNQDLTDIKGLANHIAAEIKALREQGLTVENVRVTAKLRDNERALQQIKAGTYKGEFGASHKLEYKFTNATTNKNVPRPAKTLKKNEAINLEQLVALKVNGIKVHLSKQDTGGPVSFGDFEIAAPYTDQDYTQMFSVQIRIR